jgi:hypothetical protein
MKHLFRMTLLFACLILAYLGTAAAWAAYAFDTLAAAQPGVRGMPLSARQAAILFVVEDPDFPAHAGISFADGQGPATITSAVARDFYLGTVRAAGMAGVFQDFYGRVHRCCKAVDIGRDAMALVLNARMSKDDQLAFYVRHVYMGSHAGMQVRGLAPAALLYTGKPLATLRDHEFIRLVAMIKAPNRYHPLHQPAALAQRTARIEARLAGRCRPAGWSDTLFQECTTQQGKP